MPCSRHPQEHIEEYGAHWNFFCTIAVVTLLAHLLPNPPPWLGLVVACAHQAVLSAGESSESDCCYCFAAAKGVSFAFFPVWVPPRSPCPAMLTASMGAC